MTETETETGTHCKNREPNETETGIARIEPNETETGIARIEPNEPNETETGTRIAREPIEKENRYCMNITQ